MHKTAVCTETHRQSYPGLGGGGAVGNAASLLMGMLANGSNGSTHVS